MASEGKAQLQPGVDYLYILGYTRIFIWPLGTEVSLSLDLCSLAPGTPRDKDGVCSERVGEPKALLAFVVELHILHLAHTDGLLQELR